jgi:hypothetical protein
MFILPTPRKGDIVRTIFKLILVLSLLLMSGFATAQQRLFKPFIVASSSEAGLNEKTTEVVHALEAAGFEIAGQYSPLPDSNVIVVTNDTLKQVVSQTRHGGYGAGQRVSVSELGANVEVSFVNPLYIQHAYRMGDGMQAVYDQLSEALGNQGGCGGGNKKMTAKKLGKFNYMITMPHFDDATDLGSFESYDAAIAAVEAGLSREGDGLSKVYRIDIPGKEQTVFGVGMKSTGDADEDIDETYQMGIVDFEGCRKRAYFPYAVLVDGGDVMALHMRFRMAVHFPDLSMMGKHGFTKLMPFPKAIEEALEAMVNNP